MDSYNMWFVLITVGVGVVVALIVKSKLGG